MRIRKIILGIGLGASLAAAGCYWWLLGKGGTELRLEGTVEVQEVRLGSKIGGRVAEVLIREGDLVQPGQVLVHLEAPELEAQREQLLARVQALSAALEKMRSGARANALLLQNGNRPEDIAEAEAALAEARGKLHEVEAQLREATLRAPGQAVVEVLSVRKGDLVTPKQTIVRVLRGGG